MKGAEYLVHGATFIGWRKGYGPAIVQYAGDVQPRIGPVDDPEMKTPEVAPLPSTPNFPPHAGEMRDAMTGVALSALESIRSRKPPEPWRPSVDDWDLLPDAGR